MFNQIKTSAKNKEVVTVLTRKFGLGAENVIARIAIVYSLQMGHVFFLRIQKILVVRNILRMCCLEICIPCMQL